VYTNECRETPLAYPRTPGSKIVMPVQLWPVDSDMAKFNGCEPIADPSNCRSCEYKKRQTPGAMISVQISHAPDAGYLPAMPEMPEIPNLGIRDAAASAWGAVSDPENWKGDPDVDAGLAFGFDTML